MSDSCLAVDSLYQACNIRTKEGSKWCLRHDQERKKLYAGYKAHHAALDTFPHEYLCRNIKNVKGCASYDTMKAWSQALQCKYRLLNRCINARAYFTERFFGNDMDFGHKTFWHYLKKQRTEVETILQDVERRAYELLLESQNATWVLGHQIDPDGPTAEDCHLHGDEESLSKPASNSVGSLELDDLEEIEDPLDVAIREKRQELLEKLLTRLARYCAPFVSKYYQERLAVIWACVCRAVYTEPSLMLVAQNYENAASMLKATDLDLATVEKLWEAVKHLYVHDVRAAIDDVLHPIRNTGDYVLVLGTRVYRELSGASLPFHAWGHMTAVFPCYSCVRKVCKTVDDIVALTRYALLTGSNLAQSQMRYQFEYDTARALTICGFIPNVIEDFGPRYSVQKGNCCFQRNTPHWSEVKTNYVICVGLSLNDEKSQLFVNACLRHPDLKILARKGVDGRIIKPKKLCGSRTREASTRAGLKNAPWGDSKFYSDTLLEETWPVVGSSLKIQDCFQLAILDDGDGTMVDFIDKLIKLWYQVYQVEDFRGLFSGIGNVYLDNGELELNEHWEPTKYPLVPNVETDMLYSYQRLWGKEPSEGKLVDDEIDKAMLVPERFAAKYKR